MYYVVEFDGGRGGDIGIVHEKWLTPRKKETHWPPHKLATRFHKSLTNGELPEKEWELFPVRRIFYTTDDILKAREKEKQAVIESDVLSSDIQGNDETRHKRKRRRSQKLMIESADSSDSDFPKTAQNSKTLSKTATLPTPPPHPEDAGSDLSVDNNGGAEIGWPAADSDHSFNFSSRNASSITSNDNVLNNVCRQLSTIRNEINEIKNIQSEVLEILKTKDTEPFPLTDVGLKLPCTNDEEVMIVEEWLGSSDNEMELERTLSTVGGRKVENVTRRILEKLFTNQLALRYNWTGKNGKVSLKGLHLIATIKSAVRANRTTSNASDDEIEGIIKSWFRFSRDRDGGRESRRSSTH